VKQAVLFLILVFGITWSVGFWVAAQPAPTSLSGFLAAFLPQVWAPTLVALTLVAVSHGASGVRTEVAERLKYRRGTTPWLALAALTPAIAIASAVAAARFAGEGAAFTPSQAIPFAIGMQIITGAVGEELGWRGFLLPRLRKHYGPVTAAWVMGLLWSLWHLPAWFVPWLPHRTFPLAPTLIMTACFGVFMAFVFYRAGESVLATILAHLSLNIMTAMGGVRLSSFVFWATLATIFSLIAISASIAMRRSVRGIIPVERGQTTPTRPLG
jgi:membrane protease YdiL (CAAX protease family)